MKMDTYSKRNRGSVSVEAAISLMIFIMAAAGLIYLMRDLQTQEKVRQGTFEISRQMAAVDIQNDVQCFALAQLLWATNETVKGEKVRLTGAHLEKDGVFELEVKWHLSLPLGQKIDHEYELKNRLLTRGYDGISQNEDDLVYVTETGGKYHLSGCYHLAKSQKTLTKKEAVKNGYSPCWHCIGGLEPFEKAPGAGAPEMGKAD